MKTEFKARSFSVRLITLSLLISFVLSNAAFAAAFSGNTPTATAAANATDLTQLGREGTLRENPNFTAETKRLAEVLAQSGSRQPLIVDEAGLSSDAIVEKLALEMVRGRSLSHLKDRSIVKLESSSIFSRSKTQADAIKLIRGVIDDAAQHQGAAFAIVRSPSRIPA
jgi:ATP-dependent Clp protease ATP-binding subunit ClpA